MESYFERLRHVRCILEGLIDENTTPTQVMDDLHDILIEDCGQYVPRPFDI